MNAFLILESGATKLAWVVADKTTVLQRGELPGLHPFLSRSEDWQKALAALRLQLSDRSPRAIHYYGTGCSQDAGRSIVRNHLNTYWSTASLIEVNSDLLAAARASWQHQAGVVCILGTGSNAAYYDGQRIVANRGGLGYVLGDEGAGADLGKLLLSAFLNHQLPETLNQTLMEKHQLDRATIISTLYQHPNPSRYLAQFAPVVREWITKSEFLKEEVLSRFRLLTRNSLLVLCQLAGRQEVAFVGGIATYYERYLQAVLDEVQLKLRNNPKAPIDGLIEYHQQIPERFSD